MSFSEKIQTIEEIAKRTKGKEVVMCHGVWDLVHPGHVAHLEEAAQYGDVLVVGVTADSWVRKAKGEKHPVFGEEKRAGQIAALEMVDFVVVDNHETPVENLYTLRPVYYAKGQDYAIAGKGLDKLRAHEAAALESYGGKLVFTSGLWQDSSTARHEQLELDLDVGPYHRDPERYKRLVEAAYCGAQTWIPSEYGRCIEGNLLMLTIRLARYKFAARMLSAEDKVLEVGCGYGLGAIFMGQFCRSVLGIDVQQACIEEAERFNRRENVSFRQDDFLCTGEGYNLWDVVVAMDVIEHLTEEQGRKFVQRLAVATTNEGMVIVGTPSVYSWPYQSEFSQLSHVKCYDQEELKGKLEEHFTRVLAFGMNDEVVHTGNPRMAWYYFFLCFGPRRP